MKSPKRSRKVEAENRVSLFGCYENVAWKTKFY